MRKRPAHTDQPCSRATFSFLFATEQDGYPAFGPSLRLSRRSPDKLPLLRARLHVLAPCERRPQVRHEVCPLLDVTVAKQAPDRLGRFLGVVERDAPAEKKVVSRARRFTKWGINESWGENGKDLREKVVHDVVFDDAVEDVAADEAELAINGGHCALDKRPAVCVVVRRLLVRVVEVRDCDYFVAALAWVSRRGP